ncbi:MAG: M23 family metallopeptidase [Candidatus Paceibacterota bacterium]
MKMSDFAAVTAVDPHEETALAYQYPLPLIRTNFVKRFLLKRGIPANEYYHMDVFDCARSPQSHVGPFVNAIDFLVPDGTIVLAARDGAIIDIKEDSSEWGDNPRFRDKLNYVTVDHGNGEFSQYCHLRKGSVAALGLSLNRLVSAGQQIAVVGKTGWTDRDHLHFIVFKKVEGGDGFKSLKIQFIGSTDFDPSV